MRPTPFQLVVLFLGILLFCVLAFRGTHQTHTTPVTAVARISALKTEKNKILRIDTGENVILKGAVSDYFRYRMAPPHDIDHELALVGSLQKKGANIIGLYFDDFPKLKENIAELDTYVQFTSQNGMYLYVMPVARAFSESYYPISFEPQPKDVNDLTELITFLSSRYANNTHILYGFGAEPDFPVSKFQYWFSKQEKLAQIVRANAPDALLVVTGIEQYRIELFKEKPFPFDNVIYQTGGYLSADDADYEQQEKSPEQLKKTFEYVFALGGLEQTYPILVGEFGGNVTRNFSSEIDLSLIQEILAFIKDKKLSYTAYRLGAHVKGDGLSLFDMNSVLTPRGEVFTESFSN